MSRACPGAVNGIKKSRRQSARDVAVALGAFLAVGGVFVGCSAAPSLSSLGGVAASAQETAAAFRWPDGKKAAVSLSFDDARESQVGGGTELLDRLGAKVTFYVVPRNVEKRLAGWRKAVAAGHEIANHSLTHPCTGNFGWSRGQALEDFTLDRMRQELVESNQRLKELLGVDVQHFAYPCGQSFVGRGRETKSYVPLVAELFVSGRGWLDETPNDPAFVDLAQVQGMEMDGKSFDELKTVIEDAKKTGHWVVLGGHEIGPSGRQTTEVEMLEQLVPYLRDTANQVWLAPVGTVAEYVREQRGK